MHAWLQRCSLFQVDYKLLISSCTWTSRTTERPATVTVNIQYVIALTLQDVAT